MIISFLNGNEIMCCDLYKHLHCTYIIFKRGRNSTTGEKKTYSSIRIEYSWVRNKALLYHEETLWFVSNIRVTVLLSKTYLENLFASSCVWVCCVWNTCIWLLQNQFDLLNFEESCTHMNEYMKWNAQNGCVCVCVRALSWIYTVKCWEDILVF